MWTTRRLTREECALGKRRIFYFFGSNRGRPLGRREDSRLSLPVVRLCPLGVPHGMPRLTLVRMTGISASVISRYASHPATQVATRQKSKNFLLSPSSAKETGVNENGET